MSDSDESVRETAEAQSRWPIDPEAPHADVVAQRQEVGDEPTAEIAPELPLEANLADAVEQRLVVTGLDEEVP